MAKLSTKGRKALPAKSFAEPGKSAYPIENKAHAADAKARATDAERAGRISKSTESKIDACADEVLGRYK